MSQNQNRARFAPRAFWRRLPIRAKLLAPIIVTLVVAMAIMAIRILPPVTRLAEEGTRENYSRALLVMRERMGVFFTTARQDLIKLTNSYAVTEFVASLEQKEATVPARSIIIAQWEEIVQPNATVPYESLRFLSRSGQQLVYITINEARTGAIPVTPESLVSEGNTPYFQEILKLMPDQIYLLPPTTVKLTNPERSELLWQMAIPVFSKGTMNGVIIAAIRARDFMTTTLQFNKYSSFALMLVNQEGTIIAALDPQEQVVSLLGDTVTDKLHPLVQGDLLNKTNLNPVTVGGQVYSTVALNDIEGFSNLNWTLVAFASEEAIYGGVRNIMGGNLFILFATFAAMILGVVIAARSIIWPLVQTSQAANRFAGGDFNARAPVINNDEVGQVASALNTMGSRFSELVSSLETRVAERTRNLEITAEISRDAALLRNIEELLQRTVNAIRDRFNFYHAQVFLIDDLGENAVLVTSTGEAGRQLLARKHKLPVGSNSIVGQVTAKGRTFITLDTEKSEVPHRFNPLLPETRSEIALPLRVGDKVIGAMDIQSVEANAFKESDVQIFQMLADQLAIAIDNARLISASEHQVQQVADLNRQLTSAAWNTFLEETRTHDLAFQYDLSNITAVSEVSHDGSVSAEIKVRGETIGQLSIQQNPDELLSEEDHAILQAVADRVALAVENARLIEQSQIAAAKIQHLYEASRTLGAAVNLEEVYKIAIDYLSAFEVMDNLVILRALPDPVYKPAYLEHSASWMRHAGISSPVPLGGRVSVDVYKLDQLLPNPHAPQIVNLDSDPRTQPGTGIALLESNKAMGIKSMAIVPLISTNLWFGMLLCQSEHANAFSTDFIQFVSAIADQIAIAIDNRRLFENVQAEARRNRALAEAAQISGQVGLDFAARMDSLFRVIADPADFDRWWFGQLGLVSADSILYRVTSRFAEGSPLHQMVRIDVNNDRSAVAEVARIGELVVVNDPTDHFALSDLGQDEARAFGKHIAVPLRAGPTLVGVLMLGRALTQPDIDERDVQLAVTLANQIVIVMENQRLFTTAEAGRQTLETVLNSLPTGVVVVDAQTGQMSMTNGLARELLGLDEPKPYLQINPETSEPLTDDQFPAYQVLLTRKPVVAESITVVMPSGDRIDLIANAAPITDKDGKLISSVSVLQDVTELRELQSVLQNSLRETTSLYEISRSIATENELSGIIGVIAEQVLGLFVPDYLFAIFRDENETLTNIYSVELSEVDAEDEKDIQKEVKDLNGECPVPTSILRPNEVFVESDIAQDSDLANDPQLSASGIISISTFPFTARGHTVGWLVVGLKHPQDISAEERRFLSTLADQAAIAAENARLTQATAQALSETTQLFEASYAINRAVTVENASEIILEQVQHFSPAAVDLILSMTHHEVTTLNWIVHWENSDFTTADAIHLDNPPVVEDTSILEAGAQFIDDVTTASAKQLDLMRSQPGAQDYVAQASIPLTVAGHPTGRLIVSFNHLYRFGRTEQQFLTTITDQAAIVINNIMLVQQTQDSLEEIGTLYQSSRAIADASDLGEVLQGIIDHAAPPIVTWAILVKLLAPTWDSPDVAVEISANWNRNPDVDLTGMRYTPDDLPIWPQVSTEEPFWIEDINSDPSVSEAGQAFYQTWHLASVIGTPLTVAGKPIGTLFLGAPEHWDRTEREARIYSSLADQSAITIENRDLLIQAERRARQMQTSALVAQAASSILRLDELLDRTVNLIRDSFHYDHVQIFLITPDGTDAQLVASTGEAGKQLLAIRHHLRVGSKSVIGQVTSAGRSYLAADTMDSRASHMPNPYLPNTRSEMALPLVAKNRILGALDVQSNQPGTFTKEDESVLTSLADQIAIAIDNARLFELSAQHAEEMQFLFNVTRTATSTVGVEELAVAMQKVSQLVLDSLDAISVSVLLLDDSGKQLIPHSVFQPGYEADEPTSFPTDYPLFQSVVETKQPLVMNDLLSTIQDSGTRATQSISVQSAVVVPLLSGDKFVGILTAGKAERNAFNEDAVRLLQALSSTLSTIIQNARLLQEVQTANIRLREVDKLKSQFLANMSHELRTPLNSIIGFSRVILKGIDGPLTELQEQDLATIHESGKHLLNLVNDILDQAKIESGKMELSYGFFSMAELIKSVMSTAVGLVKDKPVRLHPEIEVDLPQAWGDEFRTRQVLLNLLSNSAKFTSQGSITVSAFRIDQEGHPMVQVSVTDTGIGIPQDKLDSVFEAFQQVESSTARQYEGTGLGLPIARKLIEMEGGKIWVTSELGIGSTFSFIIPVNQPEPEEQPVDAEIETQVEQAIQQAGTPQLNHRIVLAIDDEVSMVNLYRRYLGRCGYEVIGGVPEEAEGLAMTYHPSVILLDVNMPSRSGWDVLAHLKDRDETFEFPVIVCTVDTDREQAFRLGAAEHLMKPIEEQTLVDTVKRIEQERECRKILIIDDQPDSMRLIRDEIAADERFVILEAPGGAQGLDMVNSHWPDLVILDLRMPGMDGFAVLDQLRTDPATAGIPVLVITADDLTEEEHQRLNNVSVYRKQTVEPANLLSSVVSQLVW